MAWVPVLGIAYDSGSSRRQRLWSFFFWNHFLANWSFRCFSALPGGYGNSGGNFDNAGNKVYWWSSSEDNGSVAYRRYMLYDSENAYWNDVDKSHLFSVRCLQD
ncbi:MAG: hypothetical protein LBH25_07210 [Fibromonadaceae bacterium]|nr:hypothetical protein [Fibromonadaceae bacterium]